MFEFRNNFFSASSSSSFPFRRFSWVLCSMEYFSSTKEKFKLLWTCFILHRTYFSDIKFNEETTRNRARENVHSVLWISRFNNWFISQEEFFYFKKVCCGGLIDISHNYQRFLDTNNIVCWGKFHIRWVTVVNFRKKNSSLKLKVNRITLISISFSQSDS